MDQKIDFVIYWVDGNDPEWQKERNRFSGETVINPCRYRDWNLLRYWFRGVEKYAPWVHKIYFVTWGHVPEWLNTAHPKLEVVRHEDYIPKEYLPTFNSSVIELWLDRIPGLGEHFVTFNDDMFLTAPVSREDFFQKGLPCEAFLMDAVAGPDPDDIFNHMMLNNANVINRYFNKKKVLRKNFFKVYYPGYGSALIRNILLTPFAYLTGFRNMHLPVSQLKRTYAEVRKLEGKRLHQMSSHRFRQTTDLTHFLLVDWRLCKGEFVPRKTGWGRHFELMNDDINEICKAIEKQTYRSVCINDSRDDLDVEALGNRLRTSFEAILPERSGFEKC